MKNVLFAVAALVVTLACGCDDTPMKITNVTRVFMQNEGKYILYVQQPGSADVQTVTIDAGQGNKIRVLTDAPAGEPAWFEGTTNDFYGQRGTLHVHDLKQIEGAEDERRVGKRVTKEQNSPVQ